MIKNPKIGDIAYVIDKWRDLKAIYTITVDAIVDNKIVDYSYEVEYNISDCYDNFNDVVKELLKYQLEIIII